MKKQEIASKTLKQVFTKADEALNENTAIDIASGSEVKKGSTSVLCTVDENVPKAYSLEFFMRAFVIELGNNYFL